jgi:N-acetylneuraminic acid mutarotase
MRKSLTLLLAVLLFGAFAVSCATASLEGMVQNSWVSKEPMQVARSGLGVTAVNGKIYAIGGTTREGVSPSSYTGGVVGTTEEYNPATDKWVFKKSMPTPREHFSTAVFQNKIYCIGGQAGVNESTYEPIYTDVNEVYDPATDTWETKTPMPTPRLGLDANTVNGKIYLIGGQIPGFYTTDNSTSLALNEEYNPITDTWAVKASSPYATMNYASAVFNDVLYVFGGLQLNDVNIQTMVQMYDPKSDSWSFGNPSPLPLVGSSIAVTTGLQAPIQFNFIPEIFNPVTGNWSTGASMPTQRMAFEVAVVDELIYAIGGFRETSSELGGPYTLKQFATNEQYIPVAYGDPNRYTPPPPTSTATVAPTSTGSTPTASAPEQGFPSTGIIAAAVIALIVIAFGLLLYYKKSKR